MAAYGHDNRSPMTQNIYGLKLKGIVTAFGRQINVPDGLWLQANMGAYGHDNRFPMTQIILWP